MRTKDIIVKDRIVTVREDGTIFYNGEIKAQFKNDGGYYKIAFNKHSHYVHRLVAIAFLDNPLNKETVNHIDGDKSNNNLSNLEWSTYAENNEHGRKNGLLKPPPIHSMRGKTGFDSHLGKRIYCIIDGEKVTFGSLNDAERKTGVKKYFIEKSLKRNDGVWMELA